MVLYTYLQWILWKVGLWAHGCSVHQCPIFCFLNHIIQCGFIYWEWNAWIQVRHILVLYLQSNQLKWTIWISTPNHVIIEQYSNYFYYLSSYWALGTTSHELLAMQMNDSRNYNMIFLSQPATKHFISWNDNLLRNLCRFFSLPQSVYKYSIIVLSIHVLVSIAKCKWQLWKAIFVTTDSQTFHASDRVAWMWYRSVAVARICVARWTVLKRIEQWIVQLRYSTIKS